MEAVAKTKYLKGSPRKARLVIDLIRGENVGKALAILQFTNKRATDPIAKCLKSAVANATFKAEQQNIAVDPDDLFVKTCFVDMGPTKNRRRMRPAPQGRAYKEQRHYCHITILVSSDKPAVVEFVSKKKVVAPAASESKAKASAKTKVTEQPAEAAE
jgi:large subunit ribosomal protein L22